MSDHQHIFKTNPFSHQMTELLEHGVDPIRAVFWEQGTGKSKLVIDSAATLFVAGEIDAMLILAPPTVDMNWITDELPAHLSDYVAEQTSAMCYVSQRAGTQWHRAAVHRVLKHKGFAILTMAYDAFMTKAGKAAAWAFLRDRKCLYVLDESARIKTPGAKRTKSVVASARHAPYRRILTGTPVSNGPFDVYSQFCFLDREYWRQQGIATHGAFKAEFGIFRTGYNSGTGRQFQALVAYRNVERLRDLIRPVTTRVLKEEVLDLPPKLYSRRTFEMSAEQRRVYSSMVDTYSAELASGTEVDAALTIVRMTRLQQIACGYIGVGDDEPLEMIGDRNPRLDALEDVVSDIPHQGIIWCRYTKDIELVAERLGEDATTLSGALGHDQRQENLRRFKNGDVQWLVANPAVGGEGLTLTMAKTVIYYSNGFHLAQRLQSEDRAHRIGQDHAVEYIDLQALGSIDQHVTKSLLAKFDLAARVTGDQLREWIQQ